MCQCVLRLKDYFSIMECEGDLSVNLCDWQWGIIAGVTSFLQPFMVAQRVLEGEVYVTICLIPYIIYKIRKGLHQAVTPYRCKS